MEKELQKRFNNIILDDLLKRYSIPIESVSLLSGFMNILYKCKRYNSEYVLRVSHSSRRSVGLIEAEVNWINYLALNGMSVAVGNLSDNNQYVESVSDENGGYFLVTLFKKANGKYIDKSCINPKFIKNYGQFIGKMHNLSKTYFVAEGENKRLNWDDPIMLDVMRNLFISDEALSIKCKELVENIKKLSKNNQCYGLIHQDAHTGNLFVDDNDRITLFDFDDCTYSWFIDDIAIIVFMLHYGIMITQNILLKNF